MKLSVVIITKNEAKIIEKCLNSVKLLHPFETLVIDDSSTDKTREIAMKEGARVVKHPKNNFAEIRNYANKIAQGDWLLHIDADELVTKELAQSVTQELSNPQVTGYQIKRVNFYLGKRWPKKENILRLFKKNACKGWFGDVHETVQVEGPVGQLNGELLHYTHRNLTEMVTNTIVWSEIEANLRFEAKHPPVVWWRIPRVMLTTFWDYYVSQGGWSVGTVGLIESIYQAFSMFITYARLWELQQGLVEARR